MTSQDHEIHDFHGGLAATLKEAFIQIRIPNMCGGPAEMKCSIKTGWRCEDV